MTDRQMLEAAAPEPCPFCGSDQIEGVVDEISITGWAVCVACRAEGPKVGPEESVIAAWNQRAVKKEQDHAPGILYSPADLQSALEDAMAQKE